MLKFTLNNVISVEKIRHTDPVVSVFVIDDFLANPESLIEYAENKAYFGRVGDDKTAYPGIRDRLPSAYENALKEGIKKVYGSSDPKVHRCMMSLITLQPEELSPVQKMPHVDAFDDDQYASVHYLCDASFGGTAIYRYKPRNLVKIKRNDKDVMTEMIVKTRDADKEHRGYLIGDTSLFKQELVIPAKWNRLVLYPSNLLHCALIKSPNSSGDDVSKGRLSVASFFKLE
ncbi:MAG: DUF6445 family protein [Gammaproteobacteria bacterium]|nr:DUF6445 family protein [Gammaproteobacteria bacterium]